MIWSLVFYAAVAGTQGHLGLYGSYFRNPEVRKKLSIGAMFIAFNWLLYVWSVTHGHVMETSLGYFINPLINVAIGALVFKERLSKLHKLSLLFAATGVFWLTYDYGRPPWIALGLALSFASYGYIKKTVKGDATIVSMVETSVLVPFALIGAIAIRIFAGSEVSGAGLTQSPSQLTLTEWTLMVGGGAITGIPLLLFGIAAQRLPFSILGFFQYLAPTIQFLSAVFFFNEPLAGSRLAGFTCIWLALALFLFQLKVSAKAGTTVTKF